MDPYLVKEQSSRNKARRAFQYFTFLESYHSSLQFFYNRLAVHCRCSMHGICAKRRKQRKVRKEVYQYLSLKGRRELVSANSSTISTQDPYLIILKPLSTLCSLTATTILNYYRRDWKVLTFVVLFYVVAKFTKARSVVDWNSHSVYGFFLCSLACQSRASRSNQTQMSAKTLSCILLSRALIFTRMLPWFMPWFAGCGSRLRYAEALSTHSPQTLCWCVHVLGAAFKFDVVFSCLELWWQLKQGMQSGYCRRRTYRFKFFVLLVLEEKRSSSMIKVGKCKVLGLFTDMLVAKAADKALDAQKA